MKKAYLGDGLYVEVREGMFRLTTEDGYRVTNTIWLEPDVYEAFTRYAEQAFEQFSKQPKCRSGE